MKKKGILISFEGPEGSGKSTQIKRLASFLKKQGLKPLVLREPGGTRISEAIRKILLNARFEEMADQTELLLYLAARSQIVREKIMPALNEGRIVICDRYEDSTLAYQGFGRKMGIDLIERVSPLARGSVKPRLTFLMNLAPEKGFARVGKRDRMEKQSLAFHRRVYRGFLTLARREPKRFVVINALLDRDSIHQQIKERIRRVI